LIVAALGVFTASAQLNPTVKVLPRPQMAVPPECEQGLAPAQPRVMVTETPAPEPQPARAAAPPSLELKTRLRNVQAAAEQGNRDAFKSTVEDARSAMASYPRGGERDAANDVLSVYNDLERLWDYSLSSPTGAFFDASTDTGAMLVNMMRRYPDYSKSISDSTLNIGGQVIYPTRETRQFLIAEAARRLGRLGVRTPTRITEMPPPQVAPAPQPTRPVVRPTTKKPTPAKVAHAPRRPHTRKPVRIAQATVTPPQPRRVEPAPVAPAPTPTPVPAPVPAPTPQPVVPTPPTVTTVPPTTTTESAIATATETPTTTTAATTTAATKPQPGGRMNLLFAVILIIIGIGVLIILFRASD
jgi:hypothetical protein